MFAFSSHAHDDFVCVGNFPNMHRTAIKYCFFFAKGSLLIRRTIKRQLLTEIATVRRIIWTTVKIGSVTFWCIIRNLIGGKNIESHKSERLTNCRPNYLEYPKFVLFFRVMLKIDLLSLKSQYKLVSTKF